MFDVGNIDLKTIYEYPVAIKWHIENYFQRRTKKDGVYYQSPKFTFGKSSWRLRLYPNGDPSDKIDGNVELYLEKLHSSFESHQVSFTMGIKNEDGTVYVSQQFTKCFEGLNDLCGTRKMASRSQLFRDRKEIAPKNRLTVYVENFVLTRNLVTDDDDDQTSTSTDEEDTDSPPSDLEGVEILARNMKDLFLNEGECDVKFKVKSREFRAHLAVLVARSSVFASMFKHDMSEKNTGIVNIPDCSAEAFKELLLYLYSGTVAHSSSDITFDLYEASVKYDLEFLKRKCVYFMKEDMSIDTFCDILAIALKHNEMEIINIATDFFTQHMKNIFPTVKWQTFMKENHIAANELLIKAIK